MLSDSTQASLSKVYLDSLQDRGTILTTTLGAVDARGRPSETPAEGSLIPCRFRELSATELAGQGEVPEFTAEIKVSFVNAKVRDVVRLKKLWGMTITPIDFEIVGVQSTRYGQTFQVRKRGDG